MKKKVFFQVSVLLYSLIVFFLCLIGICIWLIAEYFRETNYFDASWLYIVIPLIAIAYLIYTIIRFAKNRIILGNNEIFVPGHWGSENYKIQHETHIAYLDIKGIFMVSSKKNSLNKKIRLRLVSMPYIVFNYEKGNQKAINVFYFSKKQVIRIIDEAIIRAKKLGNPLAQKSGKETYSDYLQLQKRKRQK